MGRHRPNHSVRWPFLVAGILIGALLTTLLVVLDRPISGQPVAAGQSGTLGPAEAAACDQRTPLSVVAPAVLEPVVKAAAERRCIALDLHPAGGRAGTVASRQPGVDVWITDSRLWAMARGQLDPAAGVSVASSPVVMAVGTGIADAVGGDAGVSWGLPLTRKTMPQLQLGIQDPASTAVGLLTGQGVFAAAVAALHDEFTALSATAAGLAKVRVADAAHVGPVGATEVVYVADYASRTASGARVLRGREGEPFLDFPAYTVTADQGRKDVADVFVTELASPASARTRAAAFLREPDGTAAYPTQQGGPRMPMPDQKTALRLFGLAQSGSVPGRDLVAVDVSGSMAAKVGGSDETLMDVVRRSGLVALTALPDQSSIGLWEFASRIDGERDYRELIPITRLGNGRPQALGAVQQLSVVPDGATGLYDTLFAAYQRLQEGYDPAAAQYLVVLTDGKNEKDRGLDLNELLDALHKAQDPKRPISLVAVGYGQADITSLQRIADVMGGNVYAVSAAEQIVGVLIDAIGHAHTA